MKIRTPDVYEIIIIGALGVMIWTLLDWRRDAEQLSCRVARMEALLHWAEAPISCGNEEQKPDGQGDL